MLSPIETLNICSRDVTRVTHEAILDQQMQMIMWHIRSKTLLRKRDQAQFEQMTSPITELESD